MRSRGSIHVLIGILCVLLLFVVACGGSPPQTRQGVQVWDAIHGGKPVVYSGTISSVYTIA
ncbi:MAG TPA: hypothetical protein VFA41_02370 [Ktedonobacteraceae bacterium]|jgi:hypothetical protein|nr:hypothetical protein [Ktedonobacteraceae bacterium]